MKLTHKRLKQIIREELKRSLTVEISQGLSDKIKCSRAGACPKGMIKGGHKSSKNPCGCYWGSEEDTAAYHDQPDRGAPKCPKGQKWAAGAGKCVRPVARAMPKASRTPPGDDRPSMRDALTKARDAGLKE